MKAESDCEKMFHCYKEKDCKIFELIGCHPCTFYQVCEVCESSELCDIYEHFGKNAQ